MPDMPGGGDPSDMAQSMPGADKVKDGMGAGSAGMPKLPNRSKQG
jgi:hypothetical protein